MRTVSLDSLDLTPEGPEPEPHFENELAYLEYVWRDSTKPDRLRYMAAKACADFHFPSLRAVGHVTDKNSVAAMVDRARSRVARYTNVVQLQLAPAAHDPAELKPNASSSENNAGFRRRF
jgi:hypothetical protein